MDLLQRLIAGSGSASSKQHRAPTPSERLASCKKLCNALQNAWRSSSSLSDNDATTINITNIIRRLNTILEDESRKAAPHSCLLHTASNQIYIIIAKLALSSTSRELIAASTHFFHFLINGEVEGVLDSKIFARSLIDLVRRCIAPATKVVNEQEESSLIELLFEICTKVRLDPAILPAWFYPERSPSPKSTPVLEAKRSQFPLFYLLIDYVHYDGSIGDFSRMALLYLTETAPRSPALEKWMMESDLAHQMASGLSALYGRLSRQAPDINRSTLPILAFSDGIEDDNILNIPDEERGQDTRAFLAYLQFWQDALSRCQSPEVRDTLLDSFQILFVEQLLYPSLLESSDVEGGSTSAVILHLGALLEALEHPQLISRMLDYLFATKSQPALTEDQKALQRMSMSRRKSMEQLANLAQLADHPSPDLFSLLDLIVFSLRSSQSQTVTASMRLLSILLRRHHPHVRDQLLMLEPMPSNARQNLNGLNHTMMTLFDYARAISQVSSIDQSYAAALQDAQIGMERHSCLMDESTRTSPDLRTLVVSKDCKVIEQAISSLGTWFSNDTLVNLELTGVFTSLAACEYVLMRSWLDPVQIFDELNAPTRFSILTVIGRLTQQVKQWRSQFVEWDAFYSIQRVEIANDNAPQSHEHDQSLVPAVAATSPGHSKSAVSRLSSRVSSSYGTSPELGSTDSRPIDRKENERPISQRYASSNNPEQAEIQRNTPDVLSATLLETRIPVEHKLHTKGTRDSEYSSEGDEDVVAGDFKATNPSSREDLKVAGKGEIRNGQVLDERPTASLRHLLTQAIILQEFILELAAALQIRATLFDEVDLS